MEKNKKKRIKKKGEKKHGGEGRRGKKEGEKEKCTDGKEGKGIRYRGNGIDEMEGNER